MKKYYCSPNMDLISMTTEDILTVSQPEDQRGMTVSWGDLDLVN